MIYGKSKDAVLTEADAKKNKVQLVKTFKLTIAKGPDLFDLLKSDDQKTEPSTPTTTKKNSSLVPASPRPTTAATKRPTTAKT